MRQSPEEFERVMMPHAGKLLRFARRLTGSRTAAEDLVQDTFLHAWRGLSRFQEGPPEGAWLFRILMNLFYDLGRKRRVGLAQLEDYLVPDRSASVPERLEIAQALGRLSEEHRSVLLLAVVEGFTCLEISEILSIPIGTVMSRLNRARQSLRELLAPEGQLAASCRAPR